MMEMKKKRTALEIIRQYDGPPIRIMEVCMKFSAWVSVRFCRRK